MAKAYITRHAVDRRGFAQMSSGEPIGALCGHLGDSIDLDFTDGVDTTDALESGLYLITIDGANARLKIDKAVAATTVNGQFWFDGSSAMRFIRAGEKISVVAA
ncbi:MAG: hypothetical protein V4461_08830 [Pseudomonadota bacterium]